MSENQSALDAKSPPSSAEVPADLPLFVVAPQEIEAVLALVIPAHPATTFDDEEVRRLVATAFIISLPEKIQILMGVPRYTQEQVDALVTILRDESAKFSALNQQHALQQQRIEQDYREMFGDPDRAENQPATVETLSAGEVAGLLLQAMKELLEPIGSGEARRFFDSFFNRIAWAVEQGGLTSIEGTLVEIFGPELRDPRLNPSALQPESDARFINTLIRPALSKLRTFRQTTVYRRGTAFAVSLVIDGPDESRGRVKQRYRLGALLRADSATTSTQQQRDRFIGHLQSIFHKSGSQFIELERLSPFAAVIRRAVELRGYRSELERSRFTFLLIVYVLQELLPMLTDDQRREFLSYVFRFDLRSSKPVGEGEFADWFLSAVDLDKGSQQDAEQAANVRMFRHALKMAVWWPLSVRVLILQAYRVCDSEERYKLYLYLRSTLPRTESHAPDAIVPHPTALDLVGMLRSNLTDANDFIRLVEARVIEGAKDMK
jgi:hypothetical protein